MSLFLFCKPNCALQDSDVGSDNEGSWDITSINSELTYVNIEKDCAAPNVIEQYENTNDEPVEKVVKKKKSRKADNMDENSNVLKKSLNQQKVENNRKYLEKIQKIGDRYYCRSCKFQSGVSLGRMTPWLHSLSICGAEKEARRSVIIKTSKKKKLHCGECDLIFTSMKLKTAHHKQTHERPPPCSKCGKCLKSFLVQGDFFTGLPKKV